MIWPRSEGRWPLLALALLALATLSGCGGSTGDPGQVIVDQSHGRLTEPECHELDFDYASGERTYLCSAAQPHGRRIKPMVMLGEHVRAPLVLEWPCVSARIPWKAIRRRPELHRGKPLGRRSS